jgi:hypothetical protein
MEERYNPVLYSSLQHRLAIANDKLRKKLIDNQLGLIGLLNDAIRVRYRKSYEGDNKSMIVEAVDIIKAIFPPLEDVPIRKVKVDEKTHKWQLTSLIGAFEEDQQEKAYTLQIPYHFQINVGDILFRIFLDDDQKWPIICPIEIVEILGSFGGKQLIMLKAKGVIPTIDFPQEVIDTIQQVAERRLKIGY